jgi:DNA-binding MarR family transcriptional regulator
VGDQLAVVSPYEWPLGLTCVSHQTVPEGQLRIRTQDSGPARFVEPRRATPSLSLAVAPAPTEAAPATSLDRERARQMVVAAEATRKFPFRGVGLHEGNGRAALAREAMRDHRRGSEACQLEAFEQALALAAERVSLAFCARDGWVDAVRAGLLALLQFFDEEPQLGRYLVVHSAQADAAVLERRREVIEQIAKLLDDERAPARGYPPPLMAQAVANGVLGVLGERLSQSHSGALVELTAPLMSFTVLPFLGVKAARRELAAAQGSTCTSHETADLDVIRDRAGGLNSRASLVLSVIGSEPGLSNRQLAARAGLKDEAYMSRLLARLERLGLTEDTSAGRFRAKAWNLTPAGQKLEEAIKRAAAAPGPTSSFDLPPAFVGRLDDDAVRVLRVIADQPWLRTAEVAQRAGVEDLARAAVQLEILVSLELVAGEREAHQRGTPMAWCITLAGEELDGVIGRETPAPPRSAAIDLMWESGGRLSENASSLLRAIGAEPGLSNNDVASRVRIADENTISQQLARLAQRGLVANARNGGKYNAWHLTPMGERLERAIWHETPPENRRRLALDLVRDRGGRLNHRLVSVLRAIEAEPELSNKEIAERVGIEVKGHASILLARLARFGLIENVAVAPAPFEANAWQLTDDGIALEAAVRDDKNSASARGSRDARRTITTKERR